MKRQFKHSMRRFVELHIQSLNLLFITLIQVTPLTSNQLLLIYIGGCENKNRLRVMEQDREKIQPKIETNPGRRAKYTANTSTILNHVYWLFSDEH